MIHPKDETLHISKVQAIKLAEGIKGQPDPLPVVRPSLLSAQHIREYVEVTGLIAPFYIGGGRHSRLKFASYEGRIGAHAYSFDEKNNIVPIYSIGDGKLTVPANSIVYVECDLEFRLPRYIALRFNLQIRHVHRGLLLGTGPLVDPGYWGKLCIPLHNLTDEPYEIPSGEGLIWVEFTKTTSDTDEGREPLDKQFWEIKDFIKKAAQPYNTAMGSIGIRSSIPSVGAQAAREAAAAAAEAGAAKEAVKEIERSVSFLRTLGIAAAIGIVVGVFALWVAYIAVSRSDVNTANARIDQLQTLVGQYQDETQGALEQASALRMVVQNHISRIQEAAERIESLETDNRRLKQQLDLGRTQTNE